MKNKKRNKKQERFINIISLVAITVSVIIIAMSVSVSDDGVTAKKEKNAAITVNGRDVAGIDGENISTYDNSYSYVAGEDVTIGEVIADNNNDNDDDKPVISSKEYNNVTSGRLEETKTVNKDYFEDTIFLGDSRTVALAANGFIAEENTFAVNGISHVSFLNQKFSDEKTGVNGTIFDIVKKRKPARIYIALGVNGVAFLEKDTFIDKYTELVNGLKKASPESNIIIQCILPVNENTYAGENKELNNKNIDNMNEELLKIAEKEKVYFLDIAQNMKDSNNQLKKTYDCGDGIHYSFTGYSVIYDGICTHGVD